MILVRRDGWHTYPSGTAVDLALWHKPGLEPLPSRDLAVA